MTYAHVLRGPAAVTPGLPVADPAAAYWLAQVNLRLRREISWCWHQRHGQVDPGDGSLPRTEDAAAEALDWVRVEDHKAAFFRSDAAGRYLSEQIARLQPPDQPSQVGTWAWASAELGLSEADQFVLALALAHRLDAGLGPVFAAIANDLTRPFPTLALAQRLWDDAAQVSACGGAQRPLCRTGLLDLGSASERALDWQQPLDLDGGIADVLAGRARVLDVSALRPVAEANRPLEHPAELLAWQLAQRRPDALEVVPLLGAEGADYEGWASSLCTGSGRPLLAVPHTHWPDARQLRRYATLAWLARADVLLPDGFARDGKALDGWMLQVLSLGVRWFVPVSERRILESVPNWALQPAFAVPSLGFDERVSCLVGSLGTRAEGLRPAIAECARRFRLSERSVRRIGSRLRTHPRLDAETLIDACRYEAQHDLGQLARRVEVRFTPDDLVLPAAQQRQFEEVLRAMRSLTTVHYEWGTAKVWNESGLAVLFCGAPGTGKTMAAEALAHALGLDMYRVDLSQVVNKYVGETEKNLKRIFDAAERSDCVLFFDEADALFGKRTEVKDAHDRFANIEISYLLERMERLKGLAILATNRRKDLDEAFLRRLRYIIEFPIPDVEQRQRIWQQGFPDKVDTSALDFRYLAKQFALSGGHIRSVIFNACLQAAGHEPVPPLPRSKVGRVEMGDVVVQLKRELQKMNRAAGDEQFGAYAAALQASITDERSAARMSRSNGERLA